jgi:hypothetical protein
MGARRQSNGGSGFAVEFVVLFVVGLIIPYFWWIAGAAALVGAFKQAVVLLSTSIRAAPTRLTLP